MKVLIGCEESQKVCIAFRDLGYDAYSCDIQECSGGHPEWHLQMDIFEAIKIKKWDLLIAFPPCTDLSSAGAVYWKEKLANGKIQQAYEFVVKIYSSDIKKICIENPSGWLNTNWKKPNQIINPFQFGQPFKKRTCLWLKNLPILIPTNIVEPKYHYTSNSYRSGKRKDGSRSISKLPIYKSWDTAKERSKSFDGIAKAMAEQWGSRNVHEVD